MFAMAISSSCGLSGLTGILSIYLCSGSARSSNGLNTFAMPNKSQGSPVATGRHEPPLTALTHDVVKMGRTRAPMAQDKNRRRHVSLTNETIFDGDFFNRRNRPSGERRRRDHCCAANIRGQPGSAGDCRQGAKVCPAKWMRHETSFINLYRQRAGLA